MTEFTLYDIIFYLFAAITLISGLVVITSRNIIYSAFSLLFTFFGVAGIYVLLGADFVAIVQLVVYVGGILILMLFGVMITQKAFSVDMKTSGTQIVPAIIGSALLAAALVSLAIHSQWSKLDNITEPVSSIPQIGKLLINEYLIIFELLAVLLLIALVGAATIARRSREN